jgi:hypothetical protein
VLRSQRFGLLGAFISIGVTAVCAMPPIVSVSPSNLSVVPAANLVITVQFGSAIEPATITEKSFHALAMWGGPLKGTFSFADANGLY